MEWNFLTRREDHEAHSANHSMIANTECLVAGAELDGGIDIDTHASEVDRGVIGMALHLIKQHGYLGAGNRLGFGKVAFEFLHAPDQAVYDDFLRDSKESIIAFLTDLGALDASENQNVLAAQAGARKKKNGKKEKPADPVQESVPAE